MRTINLEDRLINVMARVTLEKSRPLLSVLESKSRNQQSFRFTERLIGRYGGIYLALKQEIKSEISNQQFKEKYLNFVASSALSQRTSPRYHKNKPTTLNGTIKELYTISNSSPPQRTQNNLLSFLSYNSSSLLEDIYHPIFTSERKKILDWVVEGEDFSVDLQKEQIPNKEKQNLQQNLEDHIKGLREHQLNPLHKNEIFGNKEAIQLIDSEIPCLLAYDNVEQRNPFQGFSNYIMFAGKPGTGKTMLARYAMTLGKQLANKYHKNLSLVQLDIKDSWKNGSYLNLQRQFSEINNGEQIYVVFIDEIDKALTEHDDSGAVEQFLKFRGGAEYQDKGNYMVIAGTNQPNLVHKGIMRVFQTLEIKGPETSREKLSLLRYNLSNTHKNISSWKNIYSALQRYELSGADIAKIADITKLKQRQIASNISLQGSASQIESRIDELVQSGNPKFVVYEKDVLHAISTRLKERPAIRGYV